MVAFFCQYMRVKISGEYTYKVQCFAGHNILGIVSASMERLQEREAHIDCLFHLVQCRIRCSSSERYLFYEDSAIASEDDHGQKHSRVVPTERIDHLCPHIES